MDQKGRLTFDFNYIDEDRRGGDLLDRPPDQANIAEAIQSKRAAGGVNWQHTPNANFNYNLGFSMTSLNRDTYYGAGQDPNAYGNSSSPLWIVDSQFNHFLSSHVLS
jgi:outer membrane receptor for ferrienterochelin and colicins